MVREQNQQLKPSFLPTMRELAATYQAFSSYADAHIRQLGLTTCQFDVIATLGNTQGMTMTELAEKTLVTKGTLTGVVDRMERKNLVYRQVVESDRRSFLIVLTPEGEEMFNRVFPVHIAHLKERFDRLDPSELELLQVLLARLRNAFEK